MAKEKKVSRSKVFYSCLQELAERHRTEAMAEGYKGAGMSDMFFALVLIYIIGLVIGTLIAVIEKPADLDESIGRAILWFLVVFAVLFRGLWKTLGYVWNNMWEEVK